MAQQQFHTVLDGMSYEEMYEYFGGEPRLPLPAASSSLLALPHPVLEHDPSHRDLVYSIPHRLATLNSLVAFEPTRALTDVHPMCPCRQCSVPKFPNDISSPLAA